MIIHSFIRSDDFELFFFFERALFLYDFLFSSLTALYPWNEGCREARTSNLPFFLPSSYSFLLTWCSLAYASTGTMVRREPSSLPFFFCSCAGCVQGFIKRGEKVRTQPHCCHQHFEKWTPKEPFFLFFSNKDRFDKLSLITKKMSTNIQRMIIR